LSASGTCPPRGDCPIPVAARYHPERIKIPTLVVVAEWDRMPPSQAAQAALPQPSGPNKRLVDRNCLRRIGLQHYGWAVTSHSRLRLVAVGQKLLRDQTAKLGSPPARLHEQRMDLCEGIYAPFDQLLEIIDRIGMGKAHRRQHSGQDVLCSMLRLVR
jgi:hypothetical protein